MTGMWRKVLRWLLALFFIAAGVNHFVNPAPYLAMMPSYLPWPEELHRFAAGAEILGGIGLLLRPLRRWAGWGLLALLAAVFPANVHIAMHGWKGFDIPSWVLWVRLPFQLVFAAWVWWTAIAPGANRES